MAINTYQGVKNVDPRLIEVGRAFRCSERQLWANIVLPAALPFIVTGLRLAVGRGLIGMVLADQYTAISGIGYLIVRTAATYQVDKMFVPIVTLGILGRHADGAAARVERRVAPWTLAARAGLIGAAQPLSLTRPQGQTTIIGGKHCARHAAAAVAPARGASCRARPARAELPPRCARSMSAWRSRRRTWCTPRPMWPRRSGMFAKRCIDANIIQFDGGAPARR